MSEIATEVILGGYLKKKHPSRAGTWNEAYFVLKSHVLLVFAKSSDSDAKVVLPLQPTCQVSDISCQTINKKRKQFIFKITWKVTSNEDQSDAISETKSTISDSDPKSTKQKAKGSSWFSYLTGSGGTYGKSGGPLASLQLSPDRKERYLVLAGDSYKEAEQWVNAIGTQLSNLQNSLYDHTAGKNRRKTNPRPEVRLDQVEKWVTTSRWKVYNVHETVRILRLVQDSSMEEDADSSSYHESFFNVTNDKTPGNQRHPCMRINHPINSSISDAFSNIMKLEKTNLRSGIIKSIRLVQQIDNFTDIIHLKLEPVYLEPSWTLPRDCCLIRHWRDNVDGSYVICYDSIEHEDCPPVPGHVRAELHSAYILIPPKGSRDRDKDRAELWYNNTNNKVNSSTYSSSSSGNTRGGAPAHKGEHGSSSSSASKHVNGAGAPSSPRERRAMQYAEQYSRDYAAAEDEESTECLLVFIAQMDPKGWIPAAFEYQKLFLQHLMLHVVDIRDALESQRFLNIHYDPIFESSLLSGTVSGGAEEKSDGQQGQQGNIANIPPPCLPPSMWTDTDAATFQVRGQSYCSDKVKVSSRPSLFKLLCIDIIETGQAVQNIAAHPNNRVAQALARGEDAYTFVFNIMVPGPPFLGFIVYFEMDRTLIEADTPFGRVARPFFYGNDDDFRNNRFKLIPKVVKGNYVIKLAVKDTPTLLGNKLKQYYHKADHYFEIDVDIGSSSVARNVVGLAMGYAKNIVVDMGLCLQGNDESELPEVLMGAVSVVHVDASVAKKL